LQARPLWQTGPISHSSSAGIPAKYQHHRLADL
jgi:hypothetical protein